MDDTAAARLRKAEGRFGCGELNNALRVPSSPLRIVGTITPTAAAAHGQQRCPDDPACA